jgi:Zn-dependent protease with chaperone function
MTDQYWGWKREAKIDLTPLEIRGRLPVEGGPGTDLEYTTSLIGGLFPVTFQWDIISETDTYLLEERCFISRIYHTCISLAIAGVLGGYIGTGQSNPWISTGGFLLTIVCLFLLIGLFTALARLKSPVEDLYRAGDNRREFVPVASLIVGVLPLFLAVILLEGYLQLFVYGVILVGLIGYDRYQERVAEISFIWERKLVQKTRQLPLIAANYVVMLVFFSLILSIFIFTYQQRLFLELIAAFPVLAPLLFSLFELVLLGMVLVVFREAWRSEAERFRQHGRNIRSRGSIVVTSLVVIVASVAFVFVSYQVFQGVMLLVQLFDSVGVYWYLSVTVLPIGFIGVGLCYQVVSVGSNLLELRRNARQEDLSRVLDVDAQTYVLEQDGLFAGAVGLFDEYILISQGVLDELDEVDVAAVMAHEEGHLAQGEARLTLLIAVLSPFVFTGKNILYGILDFRAREYRADEYAVSRVGDRDQVVEALDSLQEVKTEEVDERFSGVTPTLIPFDVGDEDTTLLSRIFGFYFGSFAFTQAHPDLEERKSNLDS